MTSHVPAGYAAVTPYLIIKGAAAAIDFYKQAFGAIERMRMPGPDGRVGHTEIVIEDAVIMLADEYPEMGCQSPQTLGGTPVGIHLYVHDVDALFRKAVAAGAIAEREPENQLYGDRSCSLRDPFGHRWYLATRVEDVPPDEIGRRAAEWTAKASY